jgi:hypothetical protein
MKCWSVQEWTVAAELFIKIHLSAAMWHSFQQISQACYTYLQHSVTVGIKIAWRRISDGFQTNRTSSVCPLHEDGNRIRNVILWTPHWFARWHAMVFGVNVRSVYQMLHCHLHYLPFRIQIMQKTSARDKVCYIQFWNQFLDLVWDNPGVVNALLMSGKAHFHLSQATWTNKIFITGLHTTLNELHQRPLHSSKVTLWCTVSSTSTVGPYFFEDDVEHAEIVNTEGYEVMLENFLVNALHHCELPVRFQQDGATVHTGQICMAVLGQVFPQWLISHYRDINWSPSSPDYSAEYFSFCGVT